MKPKALAIRALTAANMDLGGLYLKRRRTLVLAYHNVVSDDLYDATSGSQHMRESTFQRQVDWVSKRFDVVPLPEVLEERQGQPSRPRVAITFDDAYRGALQLALPWMAKRGLPATMFVSPGCLGSECFWWDRLPLDPWKDFGFFFHEMRAEQERIMGWAKAKALPVRVLHEQMKPATEAELADAVEMAGGHLLLGPHGWAHRNLAALPAEELKAELEMPLEWLRERHPSATIPILAFPYGLASPEVCAAARESGHLAAFLIDGSWMPSRMDTPFMLPRRNVAGGITQESFRILLTR